MQDKTEEIENIAWTVTGKVKKIERYAFSEKPDLEFDYDPMGQRITKTVYPKSAPGVIDVDGIEKMYYIRDVQGNVMAIYTLKIENSEKNLYLTERNLYGSSMLGIEKVEEVIASTESNNVDINTQQQRVVGDKRFYMQNHLGNVLATVTDRKLPEFDATESLAYYKPDVVSYSDYMPFGMQIAERNGSTGDYRYGFQGQEKDDEIKGEGNSVNYKYRMHDPRIGRFFAIDPLADKYPYNSPYAFSENRVIDGLELEGLEVFVINGTLGSSSLANPDNNGYSAQIVKTNVGGGDKTIAEVFGNSKVFKHTWLGANNTQARISEADCLFETITANRIEGEAITIVGHSHGGNVAILAAEKVYQYYNTQGIEVEINLVTLNTPHVVEGGYELSNDASKGINWIHVYTADDKVVPHGGYNKTGQLNEGGEESDFLGRPKGEYSVKKDFESGKSGSTSYKYPQADHNIEYKDQTNLGDLFKKGGFKNIVGHRGWLKKNTQEWLPKVEKTVNDGKPN
ncbi:hypothetical protein GCM10009118_24230 [Wandonia haliotis]|uniref:Fungal lipase-type domain-containing protein n=1 Tax=Wandonia haliotis TaxID=574963 RepID=A0ABP3Y388_9FLAO